MQSTLCYAYTTGQERAHYQTSCEHASQATQQHTPLTPAPTHTRAPSACLVPSARNTHACSAR
eukprot:3594567-Prymnesium_polylepis.1